MPALGIRVESPPASAYGGNPCHPQLAIAPQSCGRFEPGDQFPLPFLKRWLSGFDTQQVGRARQSGVRRAIVSSHQRVPCGSLVEDQQWSTAHVLGRSFSDCVPQRVTRDYVRRPVFAPDNEKLRRVLICLSSLEIGDRR